MPRKHTQKADSPQLARIERYAAANRECAQIILAEPERYGGPESLMVQWARMILDGYQATPAGWRLVA